MYLILQATSSSTKPEEEKLHPLLESHVVTWVTNILPKYVVTRRVIQGQSPVLRYISPSTCSASLSTLHSSVSLAPLESPEGFKKEEGQEKRAETPPLTQQSQANLFKSALKRGFAPAREEVH